MLMCELRKRVWMAYASFMFTPAQNCSAPAPAGVGAGGVYGGVGAAGGVGAGTLVPWHKL